MRFRRKATSDEATPVPPVTPESTDSPGTSETSAPEAGTPAPPQPDAGPHDLADVDVDAETPGYVDLGALLVPGRPGLELRMQVDERSQQVAAVLFVGDGGAVEIRPFAAPRSGGLWDSVRRDIAAETARRGGTATEGPGPFGTELRVMMSVTTQDGRSGQQASRVLGVDGPRWFLRATLLGKPAVDPEAAALYVDAVRSVVVVRGQGAMAPGDALPLKVPAEARKVAPAPAPPADDTGTG